MSGLIDLDHAASGARVFQVTAHPRQVHQTVPAARRERFGNGPVRIIFDRRAATKEATCMSSLHPPRTNNSRFRSKTRQFEQATEAPAEAGGRRCTLKPLELRGKVDLRSQTDSVDSGAPGDPLLLARGKNASGGRRCPGKTPLARYRFILLLPGSLVCHQVTSSFWSSAKLRNV